MIFVQETQFSLLVGWGESLHQPKICSFPPPGKIHPQQTPPTEAVAIGRVPFLFLASYSLYIQILRILIFIDIQYLQNVVFSFEKGQNSQNHLYAFPPLAEAGGVGGEGGENSPSLKCFLENPEKMPFLKKIFQKTHLWPQCLEQALSMLVFFLKFRLSSVCMYELAPIVIIPPILLVGTSSS